MITKQRGNKKASGGRYKSARGKRIFEMRGAPTLTKVAERKVKEVRVKGGDKKQKLLSVDVANVYDPKTKKYSKVKIKTILENEANRHFVRRNILTKGAVVETEKGKAKVTSRPGQEGSVNAILVQ
ncbi:30S ribosomal protein S8e [archaeon]|nr:30S ribosomal protein S8e [archaeon]|tara:strand:+ start:38 stop:415 length:378 start_codon:yes stop_codon:yes gene_type:complete